MKINFDKEDFSNFLQTKKGLTKRSCSDILSRCKSIEKNMEVQLDIEVSTQEKFLNLIDKINSHIKAEFSLPKDRTQYWSKSSVYRYSVRKYAEFKNGQQFLKEIPISRGKKRK